MGLFLEGNIIIKVTQNFNYFRIDILSIGSILILFFMFMDYFQDSRLFMALSAILGLILFVIGLIKSYFKQMHLLLFFILCFGVSLNAAITMQNPLVIGYIITGFAIAVIIKRGKIGPRLSRLVLLSSLIYFSYLLFYIGKDPNEIFVHSSRNLIPAVLLSYTILVYLSDWLYGRKYPVLWPSVALLVFSVVSIGRAGISISILVFMAVMFQRLYTQFKKQPLYSLGIVFFSFILLLAANSQIDILEYLRESYYSYRFGGVGEDLRYDYWREFYTELNVQRAIFGLDLNELPLIGYYSGNPHNSFIYFWARTGIVSFILFVTIGWSAFRLSQKSFFLTMLLAIFLLRAFFDITILYSHLDFVLFALLFIALENKQYLFNKIQQKGPSINNLK